MNAGLRYKLTSLVFFFVVFAALILQFVFPYHLVKPICMPGDYCEPQLADNVFVIPVILLAAGLLIYLFVLYPKVKAGIKFLPLVGALLVMVLLVTVSVLNKAQNLDPETRHKIMDHLGAFG